MSPLCGVFVLPDNLNNGTLENVLLQCAQSSYPTAVQLATTFVADMKSRGIPSAEQTELSKPAGTNKAIIAAITATIRPGKTTQVSISDNRWITQQTLKLQMLVDFDRFLQQLI